MTAYSETASFVFYFLSALFYRLHTDLFISRYEILIFNSSNGWILCEVRFNRFHLELKNILNPILIQIILLSILREALTHSFTDSSVAFLNFSHKLFTHGRLP